MGYCARKEGRKYDDAVYLRLQELWNAGKSASEMMAILNQEFSLSLSRSSVCGLAFRMRHNGYELHARQSPVKKKPKQKIDTTTIKHTIDYRIMSSGCLFYAGDPRTSDPCGNPVAAPGKPYCQHHHNICHQKEDNNG